MTKYLVTLLLDASVTIEVEADDPLEAERLAEEQAEVPCLCYQCSEQMDLGDFTGETIIERA